MNAAASPVSERPGGPGDRLLPWPKVREITDLSRSTAWRRERAGDFPRAVRISPNRVGWWESEVDAWKRSRSHAADSAAPKAPEKTKLQPSLPAPALTSDPARASLAAVPEPPCPVAQTALPPVRARRRTVRDRRVSEGQIAFEF